MIQIHGVILETILINHGDGDSDTFSIWEQFFGASCTIIVPRPPKKPINKREMIIIHELCCNNIATKIPTPMTR